MTANQQSWTGLQGLIDAHVHLLGGGQTLSWVDLRKANSRADVAEAIQGAAGTGLYIAAAFDGLIMITSCAFHSPMLDF